MDQSAKEARRRQALADWERISFIIREAGFNVNSFARHIGLPRGENLYQIRRGNNRLSRDVAERIHRCFPQYSIGWLLSGQSDWKDFYNPEPFEF